MYSLYRSPCTATRFWCFSQDVIWILEGHCLCSWGWMERYFCLYIIPWILTSLQWDFPILLSQWASWIRALEFGIWWDGGASQFGKKTAEKGKAPLIFTKWYNCCNLLLLYLNKNFKLYSHRLAQPTKICKVLFLQQSTKIALLL